MLTQGVWWPEGGIGAIPKAFERLARELGVEIRTGSRVAKFLAKGEVIAGVQLEGGEQISCDAVVSNLDRLTTEQMLQRPITAKPSFSYFTIHWGLETPFEGLAHHTLLIPNGFEQGFDLLYNHREFPEPPIVYLNETAQTDPDSAPPGKSNLFAVLTVPAEETHLNWQNPERYIASTKDVMRKFGFHIEEEPIFTRIQTPTTFRERDGNYRGTLYGVDESERILGGMFPLTNRDRIPNLFYCGGSVQPGAGLPMVTLSGQFAADLVK
jgi:phytoene dehydrogenase-like protein